MKLKSQPYLFMSIILPALNFLVGVNIDIYSPSLLVIADFFHATHLIVKNSVSIGVIGWGIGCFVFGILLDAYDKKKLLWVGLLIYSAISLLMSSTSVFYLFFILRFLQGFMTASITICARSFIISHFEKPIQLKMLLTTSMAYSAGPVLGPILGAFLLNHFHWQAIFIFLGLLGLICAFVVLWIENHDQVKIKLKISKIKNDYYEVLKQKKFLLSQLILGIGQAEILFYPTVGPFLIHHLINGNSNTYAYTALIIAIGYLMGSLGSRLLTPKKPIKTVCQFGFFIQSIGVFIAFLFCMFSYFNLFMLVMPICFIAASVGLTMPNLYSKNLQEFKSQIGATIAIQGASLTIFSGIILFLISWVEIDKPFILAMIYFTFALIQQIIFYFFSRLDLN